jgi:lipopolysaccharide biosynthesis protein
MKMTPERLAEIKKTVKTWEAKHFPLSAGTFFWELVDAVERLRAELERVRGEAVASGVDVHTTNLDL